MPAIETTLSSPSARGPARTMPIRIGFATSHDCTSIARGFSAINAVGYYKARLNWKTSGERVVDLLSAVVKR